MTDLHLRTGSIEDIEAVYQLNRAVFSQPWSRVSLYSALESNYDLLLCESDGILAGYLLSLTVLDESQVMQIAVANDYRRQGIATRITNACIAAATDICTFTLEVRLSNHAARQCYTRIGFEEVGYRKNYYAPDASGLREDAVLMSKRIQAAGLN